MSETTATESKSRFCCQMEKKRLVEDIRTCDMCSTNYEDHHQCYRDTAWMSGHRARSCMMSWSNG